MPTFCTCSTPSPHLVEGVLHCEECGERIRDPHEARQDRVIAGLAKRVANIERRGSASSNGHIGALTAEEIGRIAEALADKLASGDQGYMPSEQAAQYLGYGGSQPRKWMSEFAARRGVRVHRDGRRLLFRREDLDAALSSGEGER